MKSKLIFSVMLLTILVLSMSSGQEIYAQQETGEISPNADIQADITPVIGYQGRLSINGSPANGAYNMTFKLYYAESGGSADWQETKTVTVSNGLFQTALGDTAPFDASHYMLSKNLWLEVTVAGSTLPRQKLMGAPYALTLAPAAFVDASLSYPMMTIQNRGSGAGFYSTSAGGSGLWGGSNTSHGVKAESNGTGLNGAALKAQALSNGVGVWTVNNSVDATLVTSNNGTGALVKGFGGDGGEHEFIIENDGTFKQDLNASGLVKAGVYGYCSSTSPSCDRYFNNAGGEITITSTGSASSCFINFGFDLSNRYWSVSTTYMNPNTTKCNVDSTNHNRLKCYMYDYAGTSYTGSGYLMVLVY